MEMWYEIYCPNREKTWIAAHGWFVERITTIS
jgi:hypothetical protein